MRAEPVKNKDQGYRKSAVAPGVKQGWSYPSVSNHPDYALMSIVVDLAISAIALIAAASLVGASQSFAVTPVLLGLVMGVWSVTFLMMSVYDSSRERRIARELRVTAASHLAATIVLLGCLYLFDVAAPRPMIAAFIAVNGSALMGWRAVWALGNSFVAPKHAEGWRRALIIGANEVGGQVADIIGQSPWSRIEVFGFVDDSRSGRFGDHTIVGAVNDAIDLIAAHDIAEVVIALPHQQYDALTPLIADLQLQPVQVRLAPSYISLALYQDKGVELNSLPLINLNQPTLSPSQRMAKRAFDLVTATAIFVAILPVMALVAIAIKLDSPGAVFFRQERVGENGKVFKMYKFRSMVENADALHKQVSKVDSQGNVIHKVRNDPRVTRVGRLIRKTSLDELPQFLNVIKGEMSLVGPRPELPRIVDQYEPWQRQRFSAPQGITGWWQVNGRSDKPCHLNTDQDLYYIRNYSFKLDLQILFKTIPALLRGKGAF